MTSSEDGRADQRRQVVGVHHARRHHHGRHLRRRRRRTSTGRACREEQQEVAAFVEKCKHVSVMEADMATMEKEGVDTGLKVTHPLTGELVAGVDRQLCADGLRRRRGDGVPAHDERDFGFAKKYKLSIKQSISVGGREDLLYRHGRSGTPTRNRACASTPANTTA